MHENRPQAPGYLANLMARLFHEISGAGLEPLGIRAEQFPVLVQLWFGDAPVTRESLANDLELDLAGVEELLRQLADASMLESDKTATLVLTEKAKDARDPAVKAARAANQAAAGALSETEMEQFLSLMNRVIDALQAAKN